MIEELSPQDWPLGMSVGAFSQLVIGVGIVPSGLGVVHGTRKQAKQAMWGKRVSSALQAWARFLPQPPFILSYKMKGTLTS